MSLRRAISRRATSRKAMEMPMSLLIAVIIALLILVLGIAAIESSKSSAGKVGSEFTLKEAVAYGQLKAKCGMWRQELESCPDKCDTVDCVNCVSMFGSDTLRIYSIPYYIRNARLNESAYYSAASVETKACNAILDDLTKDPNGEAAQAVMDMGDALRLDTTKNLLARAAEACGEVCKWVIQRSDNCEGGVEYCADTVSDLASMPYYLRMP